MSQQRKEVEQALRQAGRAAKQGDLAAAERWSKTAERLAAAVGTLATANASEADLRGETQEEAEDFILHLFAKVAYLASVMVHQPSMAPAAFQNLVRLWRIRNLGEGEEDADRVAARLAESQARYLTGDVFASFPDAVRARMDENWAAQRAALTDEPLVPKFWEEA